MITIQSIFKNYQKGINNIPSGVSIESASYIENNDLNESSFEIEEKNEEEHAPKLFSDEQSTQLKTIKKMMKLIMITENPINYLIKTLARKKSLKFRHF